MTDFPTVRVAAVQATPVLLDAEATIDKAVDLIDDAGAGGPRSPSCRSASCRRTPRGRGGRRRRSSVGPTSCGSGCGRRRSTSAAYTSQRLVEACRANDVHLVIGVNEREDVRPGSLYNTMLILGPDGVLLRHRKTMPTMHERVFHGIGAGDDLRVVDVPGVGRVGGLICWENRMPLARWALYQGGPQIWVAPTADDSDSWQASMRHIAIEAGAFVISVPQYLPRSAFPDDFPADIGDADCLGRGGAVVIDPMGTVIGGPLYDEEGMVVADCDLRVGLRAKRWFDSVGHYSRPDLFPPAAADRPEAVDSPVAPPDV